MSQNRPGGPFSGLRMGGKWSPGCRGVPSLHTTRARALTWRAEVVREKVQDGLTGEQREIQYTQCKIVGNGSFGVVFQTKLSPSGEDAAIKRVLQDKRFKVSTAILVHTTALTRVPRTVNSRSCESWDIRISWSSKPSTIRTAKGYAHQQERVRNSLTKL